MADYELKPIEPTDPIDPTYCPTCLSGTPPRDPYFEDAIEPGFDAA